jgi:hypothetical protein
VAGVTCAILAKLHRRIMNWILLMIGPIVVKNSYYTSPFLIKHIRFATNKITIVCVRNIRLAEPDIISELRKFIVNKKGNVEIFMIDPRVDDCIIEECMSVLPLPPHNVDQFRKQVDDRTEILKQMHDALGHEDKKRFECYAYSSLPVIHMCQFDDTIYLGLQLVYREEEDDSLLAYSTIVKKNSTLGHEVTKQLTYLRKHKSNKIF